LGSIAVAQKTVIHKGYHGSIEVDTTDYSLHGRILFLDEKITYGGQSFAEFEARFQEAVENHINHCRERGQEPPFSE
jgi:predicted HicB family RNase H-like nuclease